MTLLDVRESSYEIGPAFLTGDGFSRHRAEELSTGSPVVYHRIELAGTLADSSQQAALAVIRRYALLRAPRTPRVVDGWIAADHIGVVEYKSPGEPLSLRNNPFKDPLANAGGIFEDTLQLMVALNRCSIVHGRLAPESFVRGDQGKIFLDDSGIDHALVRCVRSSAASTQFTLANNLAGLDMGQWAFALLTLQTGEPLIAQTLGEQWDQFELQEALKRLRNAVPSDPLFDFFSRCLRGYTGESPSFDSAIDALKLWQQGKLRSLVK